MLTIVGKNAGKNGTGDMKGVRTMSEIADCSVETLFPNAEARLKGNPKGFAVNSGGPNGMDTKSLIWDVAPDPCHVPGCFLALTKFLDGSPVAVRYKTYHLFKYVATPWFNKRS